LLNLVFLLSTLPNNQSPSSNVFLPGKDVGKFILLTIQKYFCFSWKNKINYDFLFGSNNPVLLAKKNKQMYVYIK
jgi:hypothetical protein